jgi:hypothetical protein
MRDMVRDILAACNRYDRGSGLTGALVFNEHFFLQAMEGEASRISEQLWKLAADNRHNSMILLSARPVHERDFRGWMVGYAGHSEALDALYLRYGPTAKLDPSEMQIPGIVGLLRAFADLDGSHFVQHSGLPATAAVQPQPRKVTV